MKKKIVKVDVKGGKIGICAHQETCEIPKLGRCDYRACQTKDLTLYKQLYVHYEGQDRAVEFLVIF